MNTLNHGMEFGLDLETRWWVPWFWGRQEQIFCRFGELGQNTVVSNEVASTENLTFSRNSAHTHTHGWGRARGGG